MKTLQERFDEKWKLDPVTGCWLWTAYINHSGFGYIRAWGRLAGAHRVSYWLHRGESSLLDNSEVMHSCATLHCVNPEHLFIGARHHMEECRAKSGRPHLRGSESPNAKLQESDVREMRSMFAGGDLCERIAELFGVDPETAHDAIHGITWKHVPGAVEAERKSFPLLGSDIGTSKLTLESVIAIRDEYARGVTSQRELARRYNVATSSISRVIRGETWGHVA